MEWLFDPTIWAGLLTLVVLEIVLGIDNLIFIAILADKLPPHQRDKARLIGLSLAMLMRLGLLTIVSWLVTLTTPLFALGSMAFSGRDLILLLGGVFLLFKATVELHERMEGVTHVQTKSRVYAGFGAVAAGPIARRVFDYWLLGQYPSEEDIAAVRSGQARLPMGQPRRANDIAVPADSVAVEGLPRKPLPDPFPAAAPADAAARPAAAAQKPLIPASAAIGWVPED